MPRTPAQVRLIDQTLLGIAIVASAVAAVLVVMFALFWMDEGYLPSDLIVLVYPLTIAAALFWIRDFRRRGRDPGPE